MKSIYRTVRILSVIFLVGRSLMSQEMIITKTDGSWKSVPVNDIEHIKFRETGTVTDYEGNVYKTVKIGNQWWMAENLRVTKLNNGKSIDNVTDDTAWANLATTETPAYCAYGNVVIYGYLYNWYVVETGKLAPAGWHVPSDDEWKEMERTLGMDESELNVFGNRGTNEGSKLAGRADLWNDGLLDSDVAFGSSGFSALPAGYRNNDGTFYSNGIMTGYWSTTQNSLLITNAFHRNLAFNDNHIYRGTNNKNSGFSIRCVKD